jgi:NAD(P)-dependent dehydrogenase (short-subunit alcohol dehydrogenase family)
VEPDRPTALVTGGTSGIGAGVVETLAAAGWRVVATGVSQAEVEAAPRLANVAARALDVTDDAAARAVVASLDRLDGLVNAAGILLRGGREFEMESFEKVVAVNLFGTMRMCTLARPLLAQRGGAIVNLASMLSFFGSPYAPAYSASKGGVAQLTKSLAAAWAPDGVRVNAVAPGWIETPLTQPLRDDPAREAAILARTPMGRWGTPVEVGGAVRFLLSEEARFVTGAVLPVDGGYLTM